jgi:hypothetical protein
VKDGRITVELEVLNHTVKEAVWEALRDPERGLGQDLTAQSIFPLYNAVQAAKVFNVRPCTVRDWHRKGMLRGRYQVISGRSCRLLFSNRDLIQFFNDNFPAPEDLGDHPCNPRKGSKAARLIEKMFAMNRLYARRCQRV